MTKTPTDAGAHKCPECGEGGEHHKECSVPLAVPTDAGAEVPEHVLGVACDAWVTATGFDAPMSPHGRYAMRCALEKVSAALAGDGWVRCSERMPEVGVQVVAMRNDREPFRGYLQRNGGWVNCTALHAYKSPSVYTNPEDVIYWRPLPNPPAMDATREGGCDHRHSCRRVGIRFICEKCGEEVKP